MTWGAPGAPEAAVGRPCRPRRGRGPAPSDRRRAAEREPARPAEHGRASPALPTGCAREAPCPVRRYGSRRPRLTDDICGLRYGAGHLPLGGEPTKSVVRSRTQAGYLWAKCFNFRLACSARKTRTSKTVGSRANALRRSPMRRHGACVPTRTRSPPWTAGPILKQPWAGSPGFCFWTLPRSSRTNPMSRTRRTILGEVCLPSESFDARNRQFAPSLLQEKNSVSCALYSGPPLSAGGFFLHERDCVSHRIEINLDVVARHPIARWQERLRVARTVPPLAVRAPLAARLAAAGFRAVRLGRCRSPPGLSPDRRFCPWE